MLRGFAWKALALGLLLAAPLARAQEFQTGPWEKLAASLPPLRELPRSSSYTLRVLYLEDDRLPSLSQAQLGELYRKVEGLLKDWYGYEVKLQDMGRRSLAGFFLSRNELFQKPEYADGIRMMKLEVDSPEGRQDLLAVIARDFENRDLGQIRSYLGMSSIKDKRAAVRAAARLFLDRLAEIRAIRLPNGKPFYDRLTARLLSFPHWSPLLLDVREADFLLTNSMIAGADSGMPIYVLIRGGITTGMVQNNLHNPYQAMGMVGLLPFLADAPFLQRERGPVAKGELLDVIATFWMHELGHFFLRYAEHYGHPHCVHVAPPGLRYVGWHHQIRKHGPCKLEHRKIERY